MFQRDPRFMLQNCTNIIADPDRGDAFEDASTDGIKSPLMLQPPRPQ